MKKIGEKVKICQKICKNRLKMKLQKVNYMI